MYSKTFFLFLLSLVSLQCRRVEKEQSFSATCQGEAPSPRKVPISEDSHLSCGDRECIAQSQENAWHYGDGQFQCDFEESLARDDFVLCAGSEYDLHENRIAEVMISCPTTIRASCALVERKALGLPIRQSRATTYSESHRPM